MPYCTQCGNAFPQEALLADPACHESEGMIFCYTCLAGRIYPMMQGGGMPQVSSAMEATAPGDTTVPLADAEHPVLSRQETLETT